MAIYKMVEETLLFPYTFVEATGAEAKHDTSKDDLAVNERGKPKTEYANLRRNQTRYLYETKADFEKMSDADKANAFYASDQRMLNRYADKGAIEKVDYSKQ